MSNPTPTNIDQILAQVATIQLSIAGVTNAFKYEPADVAALEAPFFLNEVRGGPSDLGVGQAGGSGMQSIEDVIGMFLAIAPGQMNLTAANQQYMVYTWRDTVFAKFAANLRLGGQLSFILHAYIKNWDWQMDKPIGSTTWSGLAFTLRVNEWFPQTISS